jgi:hypothetical protein
MAAPLVPLVGVAVAYGPEADPAHELTATAPYSGLRLVLLRTAAVLIQRSKWCGRTSALRVMGPDRRR